MTTDALRQAKVGKEGQGKAGAAGVSSHDNDDNDDNEPRSSTGRCWCCVMLNCLRREDKTREEEIEVCTTLQRQKIHGKVSFDPWSRHSITWHSMA